MVEDPGYFGDYHRRSITPYNAGVDVVHISAKVEYLFDPSESSGFSTGRGQVVE